MNFNSVKNKVTVFNYTSVSIIIIILFVISNVSFSQGRRNTGNTNFNYVKTNPNDTGSVFSEDSSLTNEVKNELVGDSTVRIKYFTYVPEYSYGTYLAVPKSPFLLGDASGIKKELTFDSSGNAVITETLDGHPIRAPLVLSLDDYIADRSYINNEKSFEEIVASKFQGNTKDDISKLFEKITDITIPLPFTSESIFGPPTLSLKINGAVDITASYQNNTSDQTIISGVSNSNNSINFKQEVQLTAKGTVGDKLFIDADYNTQRLFDFENQLKIKYEGYADEVVKRIEGGNVSLQTNSGLIGSSQALFGVIGEFQLGALQLSAVVSQKKSKTEVKDYSGGAVDQEFNLKVWDYSDNHYFLDTAYKASFLDYFNSTSISQQTSDLSVDENSFEIWVQTDVTTTGYRKAGLHVDLGPIPQETGKYADSLKSVLEPVQGVSAYGVVRKLEPSEYSLNKYAGFITLKISLPDNYFAGVAYKRTTTGQQFGTISTDTNVRSTDTLVLKMIKVNTLIPANTHAWELKMKNIYRLPVSKIVRDGFDFQIRYINEGIYNPTFPIPNLNAFIITIMGLDKYSNGRNGGPDNLFDFLPGTTIDTENGYIIFPTLKPFLNNLRDTINGITIDSATYWYPQIYTDLKANSRLLPNSNNYVMTGRARGEQGISNTINLGFNIVQGSVIVKIGERNLEVNSDYTVDYSTGTVVIRNAAALLSKDLRISYETNDLFTLASKTFLGFKGDYKISDKSSLGFTFVNLNQQTLNDKVRIGEEPTNNSMFGLNFQTEFNSGLLTNLVNLLPGYNTKVPSTITLRGEIASMNPDPNTNKSLIPDDNNEAVAYIDDMEGVKKIVSLGGTYNSWTMASVPLDGFIGPSGPNDSIKQSKRAKINWYNIANSALLTDIYQNIDVQVSQNSVTPFYMTYAPKTRGVYNYNGSYDTIPDLATTWNGVMKYLNTTSNDLVNENINFIEFSMKIEKNPKAGNGGKLIIDLGNISQDAIPNGRLNTEDTLGNGELITANDIGLDFMTDDEERQMYRDLNGGADPPAAEFGDPALDNNVSTGQVDYARINGTQGNINFEGGRRPDTEDLNKTSTVTNGNDYFQFEVSLNTENNPYIVGQGNNGWYQFKIPLSEYKKSYGNAVFTNITYARMWMTDLLDSTSIQMYDISLTGNQWVKQDKNDTTYNITAVSIEQNPQTYLSPIPGDALRQTIRGQNNVNTLSNEQSLSLEVFNLNNGIKKIARKDFSSAPLDLFNYRSMKLFVNGDPSFNYTNQDIYDAVMIVRFGNDSNNYYEYRAPIHPDQRPGQPWNELNNVEISFSDLTQLKIGRETNLIPVQQDSINGPPGASYTVFGNPDLKSIKEIILGVEKNRSALNSSISGSVWFNELRLVNVIDDQGFAYTASANMKLADFMDLNFTIAQTDPYFHGLDARVGSRNSTFGWDFGATINFNRFINNLFASMISEEWSNFISLPITFRHSENLINPQYYPGTDILLESAAEERYQNVLRLTGSEEAANNARNNLNTEAQTLVVSNSLNISNMQFNFPGSNFLIKGIVNQLRFNFNSVFGNSRDLTYQYRDEFRYDGGVSFGTDFGLSDKINLNIGTLLPLGEKYKSAKLYFFFPFIPLAPLFAQNFNANTTFNRSRTESQQRRLTTADFTSRDFRANRGFGFDWKFIENWIVDIAGNYNFRVGSDLTPLEVDTSLTQRADDEIFNDIFFNNGLVNFGEDMDYTQQVTINPRFNLPYIDKFMVLAGNYNVRYGWINPNLNTNVGYGTSYESVVSGTASLRLNEIFNLFKSDGENKLRTGGIGRDSTDQSGSSQSIADILNIFKSFVPNDISITYSQNNGVANSGVLGNPGFGNFWFYPSSQEQYGPSRSYQMGFSLYPGERAPNLTQISDVYRQGNELGFSTTLNPVLPENITMSLNFKTRWGFTNNLIYASNATGFIGSPTSKTSSYTEGNSIFFAGDVENFSYAYDPGNPTSNRQNLTNSFKSDISSFPFPNWTLTFSGLEKFALFADFANSVTLDNSFISEYTESKLVDINSIDIPNAQTVTQAFSPLIGLNFNFKEVMGGNLTSTIRINSAVSYSLNPIGANIQTLNTNEWSINANFAKSGFNLPLFGLSLSNDIAFALTISKLTNEPVNYEYGTSGNGNKIAGNGSTVTTVNPSVQYSLSTKVTMQLFYRYISTNPTGNTATTVPRTSKEGGLNIRILIQ